MIGNLFFMLLLERVGPYDNQYASVPSGSAFAHTGPQPRPHERYISIYRSPNLFILSFFFLLPMTTVSRGAYICHWFDLTLAAQISSSFPFPQITGLVSGRSGLTRSA